MKKFFSLVLALVMALSLTTVAWGATLQSEIDAATDGVETTVTLTANTTESITIPANKVIKLDLGTFTLTSASTGYPAGEEAAHATIIVDAGATLTVVGTGTVDNIYHGGAALWNKGGTVVLNGGTFTRSNENGINWPHTPASERNTHYTVHNDAGTMTINAGVSIVNGAGTASALANKGTLTINGGSVTAGRIAVNNKNTGSVEINGGTFSSAGSGSGPAVVRNSGTADIAGGTFTASGSAAAVLSEEDGATVSTTISGGTFTGDVAETGFSAGTVVTSVSGGTFSDDVSEYVAAGSRFDAATGEVTAMPAAGVGKYDLYDADGVLDEENITAEFVKAYKNKTTGAGNVAYYKLTYGGTTYSYFVECDRTDADCYLTLADNKGVYMYLDFVDEVNYFTTAKAYTNIGDDCGELDVDEDLDAYVTYDAKGVPSYWVEATGTGIWVLFDGECVEVDDAGALVPHTWVVTAYNAKEQPTTAKCKECDATAKLYATKLAAPAGSVFDPTQVAGYWVVVDKAPAATTDKVTSAETFDAGIAMYVGMSVMAAAGSAVVIGKKRED